MKKRFCEEQIAANLQQVETAVARKELCRKYEFSQASHYTLWRKYSTVAVSALRRLRILDATNARLMRLRAEAILENEILKDTV